MASHISMTWLVANLVHPFTMVIWLSGGHFYGLPSLGEILSGYLLIFSYSICLSLPSLIISNLIINVSSRICKRSITLYLFWLLISPVIVVVNYSIITLLFTKEITLEEIDIVFPAMASVMLIILIRYKYFSNAYYRINISIEKEISSNEV